MRQIFVNLPVKDLETYIWELLHMRGEPRAR